LCYSDNGFNEVCGPGEGDCVVGSSCVYSDQTFDTTICIPYASQNTPCGKPGLGSCEEGTQCLLDVGTELGEGYCYQDQPLGGECGFGIGLCENDAFCNLTYAGSDEAKCYPPQQDGQKCGLFGMGECDEGLTCAYEDETEDEQRCFADGPEGSACGLVGLGGCEGPFLGCVMNGAEASEGVCMLPGLAGAACGEGLGWCYWGTACVDDDASGASATCRKRLYPGEVCGYGIGLCWSPLACLTETDGDPTGICTDPCEVLGLYGDGPCDTCWEFDPDCSD